MKMTGKCREEIIHVLFDSIGLKPTYAGYSDIHCILLKAWEDRNDIWTTYPGYVSMIAFDNVKKESILWKQMNECLENLWIYGGNRDMLKCLFGSNRSNLNLPSLTVFMRTLLSILFYCEKNNVNVIELIADFKKFEYSMDKKYYKFLAGYLLLIYKKMGLPDAAYDKSITLFDDITPVEALITYIKHTSIFFENITLDDIIIPLECYDIKIYDLMYENDKARKVIGSIFMKNGFLSLKDLRFTSGADIRRFRNFGSTYNKYFYEALKRTIMIYKDEGVSNDSLKANDTSNPVLMEY